MVAQSKIGNYMERLPNVNNNGQQAPNQIPATGELPTDTSDGSQAPATQVAVSSNALQVPATGELATGRLAARTAATRKHRRHRKPAVVELGIPKPDPSVLNPNRVEHFPLEWISQILVMRPDGSEKYVGFRKILRQRRLIDGFLQEIDYANNRPQLEKKIMNDTLTNPNLQNISDLSTLAPINGLPDITPLFLYQLLVTNPDALGRVLQ
jgi:hypothetical protein